MNKNVQQRYSIVSFNAFFWFDDHYPASPSVMLNKLLFDKNGVAHVPSAFSIFQEFYSWFDNLTELLFPTK